MDWNNSECELIDEEPSYSPHGEYGLKWPYCNFLVVYTQVTLHTESMDWNLQCHISTPLSKCYSPHGEYGLKYNILLYDPDNLCYSPHGEYGLK